jgi:hypothetical protein
MRWRLGLLCVVAATAVGLTPNAASAAPLLHPVSATFTGGPDTVTSLQCVPADRPVTCRGTAGGDAAYAGGWMGTSHYDYSFVVLPSGSYIVDLVERFHGTVEGCGEGTFVVRTHETISPTGVGTGRWIIAPGGTGDFAALSGTGRSTAVYAADGSGGGAITGRLMCLNSSRLGGT